MGNGDFEAFVFELRRGEQQVVRETKDPSTDTIDDFFSKLEFRSRFGFDAPQNTPDPHARLRSERPDPDDAGELRKRFGDSRRHSLRAFIKRRLATGENLKSLVDHARRFDRAEGDLIDELGREILQETAA